MTTAEPSLDTTAEPTVEPAGQEAPVPEPSQLPTALRSGFPSDLLSIDDVDGDQLLGLLDLADQLKADRAARLAEGRSLLRDDLRGRTVALVFEKPSLRTRASFEIVVQELGGIALPMWDSEIRLGRRETIADTGRVLERYAQAIAIRTYAHAGLVELAAAVDIPIVNALSDLEHPCQALADLQTFREQHGELAGRTLTYVGDGNNVAHSLLLAGAKVGLSVHVGHPEGYAPDADIVTRATELAEGTGARVLITTDPVEAVEGSDAVYTDVWASMGQEDEAAQRLEAFRAFQVDAELFDHAAEGAIFLHCLPAHRGEEVDAAVIDGPASRVFDQAENRLHAQKALLATLLP
jgi:ornithine carbamoyltransferase